MRSGRASGTTGFSLIEVIASLMLVGTLLVAMLKAHRDSSRQLQLAQRRLGAVELLDQLLVAPDQFVLQQSTGKVPGENQLYWRTTTRVDRQSDFIGAMIVRVELFDPEYRDAETLASVEMLAPGGRGVVIGEKL